MTPHVTPYAIGVRPRVAHLSSRWSEWTRRPIEFCVTLSSGIEVHVSPSVGGWAVSSHNVCGDERAHVIIHGERLTHERAAEMAAGLVPAWGHEEAAL